MTGEGGGKGKTQRSTALSAAVWGRGCIKQRGWGGKVGGGRRADQAKNENGQSIEGMRKICCCL